MPQNRMKRKSRPSAEPPSSRHSQAYTALRRRILDGELQPQTPLSEYRLAAQLKLSRTPVREALKRLEHEGLVRFVHNYGAFVTDLSVRDIVEIYQVREQLESFAAGIAADQMPVSLIDALEQELSRAQKLAADGRPKETFDSDVHLHKQIVECTKNGRLISYLATLDDQVHRVRLLSSKSPERLRETIREHRELLDRIRHRDVQAAKETMVRHLQAACENAVRSMMSGGRIRRENNVDAATLHRTRPNRRHDL